MSNSFREQQQQEPTAAEHKTVVQLCVYEAFVLLSPPIATADGWTRLKMRDHPVLFLTLNAMHIVSTPCICLDGCVCERARVINPGRSPPMDTL